MTSAPPAPTPTPAGQPPAPRTCRIDRLDEGDIDRMVATARLALKTNLGLSDSDIDVVLDAIADKVQPSSVSTTNRIFGDLSKCTSVRRNQVANGVHAVVLVGQLIAILVLLRATASGGFAPARAERVLTALTIAGMVLTAYRLRHVISLAGKVAWNGIGPNTQTMLALTAFSSIASYVYTAFDLGPVSLIVVLSLMAALTCGKVYFSARAAVKPESMYLTAITAAIDRVLSGRKIAEARGFYTRKRQ